ncbi:cobalt-precorrin-6A reductase [Rhizobiales bacterium RZME27]|uniref:Cobalt-precorrin-6A reductase n=1 Tax=Endobacterium cereale TaxID=2663029 RepID=A0A6A8AFP1_9HYPH|nr:cobalt-precorrin-6A reductase [Endobacterium cereale]MEB2847515.1 cobalt-precorrin-6A reductase [Endobacterium cereale]MQY48026.1 cobalt-precorrin-6A reductase [Endobacterium cereale]
MTNSILILGGTTEARLLAEVLANDTRFATMLSLAGRTRTPISMPVPVRTGGFGGAQGLADYLAENRIDMLIDATHPYAARISANAAEASRISGIPLIALRREGWVEQGGDRWTHVENVEAAMAALGTKPRRAFLALGRQELLPFEQAPHHSYVIRSVDPVEPPLGVPFTHYITARGPFHEADELRLLADHGINAIVSKNSGGSASYGKIAAARTLGIEVIVIRRPVLPAATSFESVDAVFSHLAQIFPAERGE